MLTPDPTWLDVPEAETLRALAGSVLAGALVVCVGVLVLSAVAYGLHRLQWFRLGDGALQTFGRATLASVVLGALSGIVGFGAGLIVVT